MLRGTRVRMGLALGLLAIGGVSAALLGQSGITPPVEIIARQDGHAKVILEGADAVVPLIQASGETVFFDAATGHARWIEATGANPFPDQQGRRVRMIVSSVIFSPDGSSMSLTMPAGEGDGCTLEAIYDPDTKMWVFQCNPNAICSVGEDCKLLRNGDPIGMGAPEHGMADGPIVYSGECRSD